MALSQENAGPDFVGVGAQKSGTSWLAKMLDQHPDLYVSPEKEVNFFSNHFERGYDWYNACFAGRAGRLAGEISVNYAYTPRPDPGRKQFYPKRNYRHLVRFWKKYPAARDELRAHYPKLKVFMLLRNPVERAWSHYWYWRNRKERIGKHTSVVPFAQMFADDGRWMRLQGEYGSLVTYWREAFPEMGVFFYDDIIENPLGMVQQVYAFLGVDASFAPEVNTRVKAGLYREMPESDRRLALEHYRPQIERLAELTGRDLSAWLH